MTPFQINSFESPLIAIDFWQLSALDGVNALIHRDLYQIHNIFLPNSLEFGSHRVILEPCVHTIENFIDVELSKLVLWIYVYVCEIERQKETKTCTCTFWNLI